MEETGSSIHLKSSDRIKTGADALLTLDLGSAGQLFLYENSALRLDRIGTHLVTTNSVLFVQVDLLSGSMRACMSNAPSLLRYEIRTSRTVCGVKIGDGESDFHVHADGTHTVFKGDLVMVFSSLVRSKGLSVAAGFTFHPPEKEDEWPTVKKSEIKNHSYK